MCLRFIAFYFLIHSHLLSVLVAGSLGHPISNIYRNSILTQLLVLLLLKESYHSLRLILNRILSFKESSINLLSPLIIKSYSRSHHDLLHLILIIDVDNFHFLLSDLLGF
jgi:hypothetical protein